MHCTRKVEETTGFASFGVKDSIGLACAMRMIGIIVSSLGRTQNLKENEVRKYFRCLNEYAKKGNTLLHLMRQSPDDSLRTS